MRLSGAPMDPRHLSLVADGCQPVLCQPADIIGGRGERRAMSAKAVTQSNANANATFLPENCHPPNQLWLADANADKSLAGGDSCADLGLPQVFAARVSLLLVVERMLQCTVLRQRDGGLCHQV